MDKKTAINKIRKCLALAKSGEPHEAAAALRQAQKLMEQHGVEHPDLLAAGVAEEWTKSCSSKVPPRWEVALASVVAVAFGCDFIFSRRVNSAETRIVGGYVFICAAPAPEVASYTFTVLSRQLKKARVEYIRVALKRHRKNKVAAADQFCVGWVRAVRGLIASVAPTADLVKAIEAYKRANYAETTKLASRDRQLTGPRTRDHAVYGFIAGQHAQLNRGVGADTAHTPLLGVQ